MPEACLRTSTLLLLASLAAMPAADAAQAPNEVMPFAFDGPPVPVAPEVVTRDAARGAALVAAAD
jgi:hypothetical protein